MFRSLTTLLAITALLAAPICALGDTLPTQAPEIPTTTVETTTPAATTTPATTTTSTTTTTTTTPKPTTTTAAPAPAPTTPAPAQIGNWNVTDKNNITCMMLQATIQISVTYTTADNKTAVANMTVPAVGSSASGSCENNETQSISISWTPADLEQTLSDKIDITFSLNTTTKAYHVSKLAVSVYPNPTDKKLVVLESEDVELPPIPFGMSYRCSPAEKFNLTENSILEVSDLQVQAFHTATDGKFGSASECQAGDTADIVPIVVGCALAGLVVIVLIAYLVGRRRSRQSGYLSM
ncbi:lysosome-associated membrane glycoprotein 1-like [Cloeon dipterum]|uniref:lysosome-associated membrane glycoprotein 1-like n=1 Tax=Cloeon dipterum TaxID=197152 RepID=UPI00321FC388